jgi:hypothetical protein
MRARAARRAFLRGERKGARLERAVLVFGFGFLGFHAKHLRAWFFLRGERTNRQHWIWDRTHA